MVWKLNISVRDDKDETIIQRTWKMTNDEAVHMWQHLVEAYEDEQDWLQDVR